MSISIRQRQPLLNKQHHALSSLHPVLQQVYVQRGIIDSQDLDYSLPALLHYEQLANIDAAATLLYASIKQQDTIVIVGDFDTDGATSTALAVTALRLFGAHHIKFIVPNRFAHGYGLTPALVSLAINQQAALIMTVDNGITNHEGVAAAKAAGLSVIITDHHLPGHDLPEADVIVNPNLANDNFPSKNLAGVGVVFYLMLALRRHLIAHHWFTTTQLPVPNMASLLDLVAVGTVADVVPLDKNNRILVHHGLNLIKNGKCAPGITALLSQAGKNPRNITASDLGYAIAPRLNAAGRIEDMSLGINCLLATDMPSASAMAKTLNQLNATRKNIESSMKTNAFVQLKLQHQDNALPYGICLYHDSWHQGVIGIVAARVKDYYHRPTIIFAPGTNNELKGSARSIPHVHIRDILLAIATDHPEILTKFGGHAMAAGLTIERANLANFTTLFNEVLVKTVDKDALEHVIYTDGSLASEYLTLATAELLSLAGPWGQGFPEPIFDDLFMVTAQELLGGQHLRLTLERDGVTLSGMMFNITHQPKLNLISKIIRAVYHLNINYYNTLPKIQIIITHLELPSAL